MSMITMMENVAECSILRVQDDWGFNEDDEDEGGGKKD